MPNNWKTALAIVGAMLLSLAIGIWVGTSIAKQGSPRQTDESVADIVGNYIQLKRGQIEVGGQTRSIENLGTLSDYAVQPGSNWSVGYVFYETDAVTINGISYTADKFNFSKCTFGTSLISSPTLNPILNPEIGAFSYQSTNTGNNLPTAASSVSAYPSPYLQFEYGYYGQFTPTVEMGIAANHNRLLLGVEGVVSNALAIGQRFQWDGFDCELTIDGAPGNYRMGLGRGINGRTTPLFTYVVTDGTSSSTSTTTSTAASTTSAASSASTTSSSALNPRIDIYRFYKPSTGGHLYTVSVSEKDKVINTLSSLFSFEGVRNKVLPVNATIAEPDMVQVERFYNYVSGTHRYTYNATISANLKNDVKNFKAEGPRFIAFSAPASGRLPMHEFYNSNTGGYFYTASESERKKVSTNLPQFKYRGVVFYVLAK